MCGIPGAGKSVFARLLLQNINELLNDETLVAVVGLDGWHLTRAQLDAMPDSKLAHERRGIHWTFDAQGYVEFILKLRQETSSIVTAPSFDHAVKDPVPDAISVYPHHRIVIIEGLYAFLDVDPWSKAAALLDYRFFIRVGFEVAKSRLAKRHFVSGITQTLEDGTRRAEQNDLPSEFAYADPAQSLSFYTRWYLHNRKHAETNANHRKRRRP